MVADEIRKLSESAGRSADEISKLVHEIQSDTNEVADEMRQSSEVIGEGREDVNTIAASLEQISMAVGEAAARSEEIFHGADSHAMHASAWSSMERDRARSRRATRRDRGDRGRTAERPGLDGVRRSSIAPNGAGRSSPRSSAARCTTSARAIGIAASQAPRSAARAEDRRGGFVSAATPASIASTDRLLTFEVGDAVYALPIAAVLEVAEADRATCVPGIAANIAAVINWHGDPLPLVASHLLLAGSHDTPIDEDPESDSAPVEVEAADEEERGVLLAQVLVVSDRDDEAGRLGMPVDRVLGLVDGRAKTTRSPSLVVERRPVEGRVVSVLDPRRLVARAEEIIERAAP